MIVVFLHFLLLLLLLLEGGKDRIVRGPPLMNNLVPEKKSEDGLIVAVLSMTIAVGRDGHRCWKIRRGKEEGNGLEDAVDFVIIEVCVKGRGVASGSCRCWCFWCFSRRMRCR